MGRAAFTSVCVRGGAHRVLVLHGDLQPGLAVHGTLTAIVVVIVWFYYAALIFILGGEVGQVFELRRVRRRQREVFTD